MDCPHGNNSNNISIADAQLHDHLAHWADKSRCNGMSENGCSHFDPGYGSIETRKTERSNSCSKCEQKPVSAPNGPPLKTHCPDVHPERCSQQNGLNPQLPQVSPGRGGPLCFSYSEEDEYLRSRIVQNGPSSRHRNQNVDAMQFHLQNGQGDPHSDEATSPGLIRNGHPFTSIPNGPTLTPNSQDNVHVQNGPTSPRYPPVIRKRSSLRKQSAIEEEDDFRDELNDSGFGSMCRTNSREQPRRSRSQDVSDAPAEDINNNLCPKKLLRAHSSTEKTDNELEQFRGEKRRCSSEQLQRSNGSSGYYSGNNVQVDVPAGDGSRSEDLAAEKEEASEDGDDVEGSLQILIGLKDKLVACKQEFWNVTQLHKELISDPLVQPFLIAEEEHSRLMRALSQETFMERRMQEMNLSLNTACHSTNNIGHIDEKSQEVRLTSKTPDGLSDITSNDICISLTESKQGTNQAQVQILVAEWQLRHGDTMDVETKERLQTLLETHAYCEAMKSDATKITCCDPDCIKGGRYHSQLMECYDNRLSVLDECTDCRVVVQAYWDHSRRCKKMERCVLPFCDYFKDLCSETGLLHERVVCSFPGALGCLIKQEETEVLERLHQLQQLQRPAADGDQTWSANANADRYLKMGQPYTNLTPEGSLCKFGHFTPIRCKAMRPKTAYKTIVIKKLKNSKDLTSTLKLLHQDMTHIGNFISTCLWYHEIQGEKLLVCSTFLSERCLSSCFELLKDTREKYWMEACNAAVELHDLGILYLNWKVDHLMVTEDDHVKLCNFAYAVDIRQSDRSLRGSCSEDWRGWDVPDRVKTGLDPRIAPPEVVDDDKGLTKESDSWGLGCLLYQLHNHGRLPYHDLGHLSDDDIREKRRLKGHTFTTNALLEKYTKACFSEKQHMRELPGKLTVMTIQQT